MLRVHPDGSIEAVDMDAALAIRARIVGQPEAASQELLDLRAFVLALKAELCGCETLEDLLKTVRMLRTSPPDERLRIERNYWHSRSMELSQDLAAAQRARPRQELFSAPSPIRKQAEDALTSLAKDAETCRRLHEEAGLALPWSLTTLLGLGKPSADSEASPTAPAPPPAVAEPAKPAEPPPSAPEAVSAPPPATEPPEEAPPTDQAEPAPAAREPTVSAEAAELARIRARLAWSQARMAAAIGTRQSELSKMERGFMRITQERLEKARALLAPVEEAPPRDEAAADAVREQLRRLPRLRDSGTAGQRDSGTAGQRDSGTAGEGHHQPAVNDSRAATTEDEETDDG